MSAMKFKREISQINGITKHVLGERAQFFKAQFEIWWKRENPMERDETLK